MKKFLLLLLTFISLNVLAQNDYFKIKEGSFTHVAGAVMDDAKEHTDADDKPMAVFKISTENINNEERQKLYFTGNRVTEISDKVYKTGQVWIYLTAEGSEYLEIRHPDYGSTRFYFPESLCEYCTYEMVLQYIDPTPIMETGNLSISSEPDGADIYIDGKLYGKTNDVITDLKEGNHSMQLEKDGYSTLTKTIVINKGETLKLNETLQTLSSQRTYLIVKADQDDARIYIDDELVGMGEGTKAVIIGTTHTYKIQCNLYHDETGSVIVKGKKTIEKQLRPSFGYIDISTSPEQGANVYVDDEYAGISPLRTDKLQSGAHKVMVMKNMYKMTEQSFLVVDGQTTMANLNMQPNFVNVTVNTDMSSDIYVDEDYKSKGNWTGRLSEGIHVFEARKANYAPSRKEVELVLGADKNISLEAPKPITGALDVNSMPIEANIYIDGKSYGTTPNMINNLLIGIHELRLEKEGYVTLTKSINIRENETYNLNENLQKKNTAEELYKIGNDYYDKKDYVKAVEYYRKAAEQGYADAQYNLGNCYYNGEGVAKDYAEAVKWYRKAVEQGHADAQNNLGYCYKAGQGVAKDYAEAVKWYRKAAEQGNAGAQCNLGYCYEAGQGVAKDYAEAAKWYRKAAEQGNAYAQYNLGVCYQYGNGVIKDYAEAVKWYRKAAEQGDADAQNNLGYCYEVGQGVAKDYAEAVKWYRKAAEQGHARAQNNLGKRYYNGEGVAKDYAEAVKWIRKAAEQGHARAQYNLGYCYYAGQGVAKDYAEAVKWYRKAAEQGHGYAQYNLGNHYYNGEGVAKDYAEAVKWYRKAAEQGDADAQYNLGWCYQYGQGVAKDLTKAKEWYQKAADNGYEDAKIKLKELSGTQQTNSISKIKVKGGSFKKINGFVMLDKYEHLDDNNVPMALIKISTENISAEQRRRITFKGNLATYFDVQFKSSEIYLYLSTTATFIEISHPDYGKTEYWLPEVLCDYCGYEMTIVGE